MVYSRAGILPSVTEKAYVISVNSLLSVDRACQGGTHEILDVSKYGYLGSKFRDQL